MSFTPAQLQESRAEARKLTAALSKGWRPEPIRTPIQLQPNELCFAQGNLQVWAFLEGDGTYVHKSRMGFGLVGVAMVAGTAAGNRARRSRAAQEAAAQFRLVDEGPFFLTNMRFAVQGRREWMDFWFGNVRMSTCDGGGITMHLAGAPTAQLIMWPADYYFALYQFLANGEVLEIPE